MYRVIVHNQWKHAASGRVASVYGAAPYGDGWSIEPNGFTIAWDDGTIGIPYGALASCNKQDFDSVSRVAADLAMRGFTGFKLLYQD